MEPRHWYRVTGNGHRAQAFWSDGELSVQVSGDPDHVEALLCQAAQLRGRAEPDMRRTPRVMKGQTKMEISGV